MLVSLSKTNSLSHASKTTLTNSKEEKEISTYGTECRIVPGKALKYVVDELGVVVDPNIGVFEELEE